MIPPILKPSPSQISEDVFLHSLNLSQPSYLAFRLPIPSITSPSLHQTWRCNFILSTNVRPSLAVPHFWVHAQITLVTLFIHRSSKFTIKPVFWFFEARLISFCPLHSLIRPLNLLRYASHYFFLPILFLRPASLDLRFYL